MTDHTAPQPDPTGPDPYRWVIVGIATLCLTLGFGANVTVAVFIQPFEAEFGWPRADISMAYTMATLGAAAGGIVWGTLFDRVGAKAIGFFGAIAMSVSMMALSLQTDLWAIYALYMAVGGLGFACLFTPMLALVGLWFDKRRGLAMGIVTAGGAIGQGIVPFIVRLMITEWGWRDAVLYLGIAYLVILLPMMFFLKPPPILSHPDQAARTSNHNLWGVPHRISVPWLALAGVFCCITMAVPIVHLVPLGTDLGLTPETATSLLMALMVSGVVGRLYFGHLTDRIGGLRGYFLASFGQTALVIWFPHTESLWVLYAISILFGFMFSGVMTCLILCAREAAPMRITGFSVALITTTAWLGMGVGAYQGGYFYDVTGDYVLSYTIAGFAGAINIAILLALFAYRARNGRVAGPAAA